MLKLDYQRTTALPYIIKSLCFSHEAWIVGSGAEYLLGLKPTNPRDWDILIPLSQWPLASKSIPKGSVTNSFGGAKINIIDMDANIISIDVWGGEISTFFSQLPSHPAYAVHPKSWTILMSNNGFTNRHPN